MANDHDGYEDPVHLCVRREAESCLRQCVARGRQFPLTAAELSWFILHINDHPDLMDLDPHRAFLAVDALVQFWYARFDWSAVPAGVPNGRWEYLLGTTRETARQAFERSWVQHSPDAAQDEKADNQPPARRKGSSPFAEALERADTLPLELPHKVTFRRTEGYHRFVSLAGWMQVLIGARPIILPTDPLGELLEVPPSRISLWRNNAIEDGYLRLVQEADHDRRRATQFLFDVNQCWQLRSAASTALRELVERSI